MKIHKHIEMIKIEYFFGFSQYWIESENKSRRSYRKIFVIMFMDSNIQFVPFFHTMKKMKILIVKLECIRKYLVALNMKQTVKYATWIKTKISHLQQKFTKIWRFKIKTLVSWSLQLYFQMIEIIHSKL